MAQENRRKLHFSIIFVASILGILLLSLSLWASLNIDKIMKRVVSSKAVLTEGSETFKNWVNSSVDIYFSVNLFSLTNKDEVMAGGKPNYRELGPYVYLEKRKKVMYHFAEDGENLKYTEQRFYYFQPHLSKGDPSKDEVTQINLSLNTVCHNDMGTIEKYALELLSLDLFLTMPAHDYIWSYYDPLVALTGNTNTSAVFIGMNGTVGDTTTINTGLNNINLLGSIIESNGKSEMDAWTTYEANMINGTDGSMFMPGLRPKEPLYVFAGDVCRSFKLIHSRNVKAEADNRIELLEYIGDPKQSENATINPENLGFCVERPIGPKCPPAGMIDLSKCREQKGIRIPLYACQPRFYQVDPSVCERMSGIKKPTRTDQTILRIHQFTGLPLEASKKLQINMYVKPNPDFANFYKKMSGEYYVPLVWIEESGKANVEILNMIYTQVNGGQYKLLTVIYILLSFSILVLLIAAAFTIYLLFFSKNLAGDKYSENESDDGEHLIEDPNQY